MTSHRREFLQRLALGAASVAAVPASLHAASAYTAPRLEDLDLDGSSSPYDEFGHAAMHEAADEWDTSWTTRLTGRHKAMFDVPEVSGGAGVLRAGLWAKQYTDVFKVPASELSAVIVLRHAGIILAMKQSFWDEYAVGKRAKLKDDNGKKTNRNPGLSIPPAPGKQPSSFSAFMLEEQIARGVIVLGCNMAFAGCVYAVSKQDKLPQAEARTKALSYVIPGIIMQPSGIFADVLAQQNGCAFVAAS